MSGKSPTTATWRVAMAVIFGALSATATGFGVDAAMDPVIDRSAPALLGFAVFAFVMVLVVLLLPDE